MARLIFTNALDQQAKRYAWLRVVLFQIGIGHHASVLVAFRALSPEASARVGRFVVGALGPRSAKARMVRDNLRIAFPD